MLNNAARVAWLAYSRVDFEAADTDTQGVEAGEWIGFRGTTNLADWRTNLRTDFVALRDYLCLHEGFYDAWASVRTNVLKRLANRDAIDLCGHSLGGAIAQVAALDLAPLFRKVRVVTFGAPRVVHKTAQLPVNVEHVRCVNNCDVVPRVPMRAQGYTHWGKTVYWDSDGQRADLEGWALFLDRVQGRFEHIGVPGTAGLEDHAMSEYMRLAGLTTSPGGSLV